MNTTVTPPPPNEAIARFTRESVREVFKKMLSFEMENADSAPLPDDPDGQIVGSVGFIGQATGFIYLYSGVAFGRSITSKMLGLTETEVDNEMINDAFGEVCNMVVGSVKSQLCDRGWPCVLSLPSVMRANTLRIESVGDVKRILLGFRAGTQQLMVEVTVKNPQP